MYFAWSFLYCKDTNFPLKIMTKNNLFAITNLLSYNQFNVVFSFLSFIRQKLIHFINRPAPLWPTPLVAICNKQCQLQCIKFEAFDLPQNIRKWQCNSMKWPQFLIIIWTDIFFVRNRCNIFTIITINFFLKNWATVWRQQMALSRTFQAV